MPLKIYLEDHQIQLVHPIASAATAISSLASEAKEYILSKFRKDYFRSVQIDTATPITFVNRNRNFNQNLNKVPYPSMMISPEITLDNPILGTEVNPHESNPNRFMRREMGMYYYKLITDPDQKLSMFYTTNSVTTIFNFRIAVKTFIENINILNNLKQTLLPGVMQYLNNRPINIEIPSAFIEIIAGILGYDIQDAADMEKLRLYLISTSRRYDSIRKKLNMTTGRFGFFMNDITDLLITVDSIDGPSSIIRDAQTEDEYIINFRLQITAPIANNFILSIDQNKFKTLKDDVELIDSLFKDEGDPGLAPSTLSLDHLYANLENKEMVYFADKAGEEHIGIQLFSEVLTYSINDQNRHLNLIPFLKPKILNIHSYMVAKNLDLSTYLHVRIVDKNGIRTEDKVNLKTLEVDIENITSDILVSVFVDRSVYEAILAAQTSDINLFNDNFLTTVTLNTFDSTGKVIEKKAIVKSFIDEHEMNSTDVSKQLRVQTIYGIGYIFLVPETDKRASDMKICLGKDKWGNDIIKSFVLLEE